MQKQAGKERYYFPPRLTEKLSGIYSHALTMVEAPSGFGKTTAVREYLQLYAPEKGGQFWYTSFGEPPPLAWSGVCALFAKIDASMAEKLRHYDCPRLETLPEIVELLQEIECERETVLVIDNYQLIQTEHSADIIQAFCLHNNPRLHLVIITQQLEAGLFQYLASPLILSLSAADLFFSRADVEAFFRLSGQPLSAQELEQVYENTEGWVSALRLQLMRYGQTQRIERDAGIEDLLESAVWQRLSAAERDALLALSLLDRFTVDQACIMLGLQKLPPKAKKLLDSHVFITYYADNGSYIIHSILKSYLQARFDELLPAEKQALHCRAGQAHLARQQYFPALQSFFAAGDDDAMLSVPLRCKHMNYYKDTQLLTQILNTVAEETLLRHPQILLSFGFELFLLGRYEDYSHCLALIDRALQMPGGLTAAEARQISGEFHLLVSFSKFNDIRQMSAGHQAALQTLGGPTQIFDFDDAWTFGVPSALYLFWRESGELEQELAWMDECMPYYVQLTRGHGAGAAALMRAEALLLRGELEAAEALAHKTLYLAAEHGQDCICFAARLTLARAAILKGDAAAYLEALHSIRQLAQSSSDHACFPLADQCETALSLVLGESSPAPEWLSSHESIRKRIYDACTPYCMMLYGGKLLLQQQYAKLSGLAQPVMGMAEQLHFLLPKLYYLIYLAVAQQARGNVQEAQQYLRRALDLALPDEVLLPFAEFGAELQDLLAQTATPAEQHQIQRIAALGGQLKRGAAAIRAAQTAQAALTPREREVACLAQKGLTNAQIAAQLYISTDTVKKLLKQIFLKLGIRSRVQLEDKSI